LNQDGNISPDEWDAFYATEHGNQAGPGTTPGDAPATQSAPFDLDTFIEKVSSGTFTDDDMLAFSNWYMGQQLGQQAGQMDYQNKYLDYLNTQLGLNEQQLKQAQQEMEFQQGPYWDWYTSEYFPHQQERDRMDFELAGMNLDTQRALGEIEQGKAKDYALAQGYNTESAKYGADAARWQYLQMIGGAQADPQQQQMSRQPRLASQVLGTY